MFCYAALAVPHIVFSMQLYIEMACMRCFLEALDTPLADLRRPAWSCNCALDNAELICETGVQRRPSTFQDTVGG